MVSMEVSEEAFTAGFMMVAASMAAEDFMAEAGDFMAGAAVTAKPGI
jgi:hypothetical protein